MLVAEGKDVSERHLKEEYAYIKEWHCVLPFKDYKALRKHFRSKNFNKVKYAYERMDVFPKEETNN